jgi:hypothetical protein
MTPDVPQTEAAIIEMTNAFRREHALGTLTPNAALTAAARAFAAYLAKTGRFAHEADGRAPHERAEAQGYHYCFVAENLALHLDSRGFETRQLAREVVDGWKTSPGHRANMLEKSVTEIGVGIARAPARNPKFISVQLVGRPQSLMITFTIENRTAMAVEYALGEERNTLPARATVTQESCDIGALTFERAGSVPLRWQPQTGDRFVVVPGTAGSLRIERAGR